MSRINQDVLQRILSFFNQVSEPAQIADRIRDNPGYGKPSSRAYGIRPSLGERILEARDSLPGGKFDSFEQIKAVKGVGQDTCQDIFYSFGFAPPYPEAERIIRREFGLDRMTIDISSLEVQYQSTVLDNVVGFGDALRAAITSFLNDTDDYESPLMLLKENQGLEGEDAQKELVGHMNRLSTRIALVAFAGGSAYPPEHGESIEENWAFFLKMESFSDHLYWAIIDRSGKQPAYHYGLN